MSKGIKIMQNLDKLEVCYIAKSETLMKIENEYRIDYLNFYLERIERKELSKYYKIVIYDNEFENNELIFGELKIGNSFEKYNDELRYCWLSVYNENLYINSSNLKVMNYIYPLQDELGLSFNNITNLEIAKDANFNWYKRISRQIFNNETINVVLNRAYPNTKQTLLGLCHEFSCTSEKLLNGTIRIKNKERNMKLNVYDKTQEILDSSGKFYIQNRFISIKKVFRAEVLIKNMAIDDYCKTKGITQYDIYMRLNDNELLNEIFLFFANRLIHFIDKRRNVISILDL